MFFDASCHNVAGLIFLLEYIYDGDTGAGIGVMVSIIPLTVNE